MDLRYVTCKPSLSQQTCCDHGHNIPLMRPESPNLLRSDNVAARCHLSGTIRNEYDERTGKVWTRDRRAYQNIPYKTYSGYYLASPSGPNCTSSGGLLHCPGKETFLAYGKG